MTSQILVFLDGKPLFAVSLKGKAMIYAANTQNQVWTRDLLLKPYLEATERLNRVWAGIDFHSLYYRPLSLKERLINLLSGAVLLLPLINAVIWIFWVTFGNPEILSDSDLLHN